jgi:hypothetical protein
MSTRKYNYFFINFEVNQNKIIITDLFLSEKYVLNVFFLTQCISRDLQKWPSLFAVKGPVQKLPAIICGIVKAYIDFYLSIPAPTSNIHCSWLYFF